MPDTWQNYPQHGDAPREPEPPATWPVYGDEVPVRTDAADADPGPRSSTFPDHDRPSWKPAVAAALVVVMVFGFLGMLLSAKPQPKPSQTLEGYARPGLPSVRTVQLPPSIGDWQRSTLHRLEGPRMTLFTGYDRAEREISVIGWVSADDVPTSGRPFHHPGGVVLCDATATRDRNTCTIPLDEGHLSVTSPTHGLPLDDLGQFSAELAATLVQ